jgi:hypothetical protein
MILFIPLSMAISIAHHVPLTSFAKSGAAASSGQSFAMAYSVADHSSVAACCTHPLDVMRVYVSGVLLLTASMADHGYRRMQTSTSKTTFLNAISAVMRTKGEYMPGPSPRH